MFDLDAPIVRIGGPDIPAMPFAAALEHCYMEPEPTTSSSPCATSRTSEPRPGRPARAASPGPIAEIEARRARSSDASFLAR